MALDTTFKQTTQMLECAFPQWCAGLIPVIKLHVCYWDSLCIQSFFDQDEPLFCRPRPWRDPFTQFWIMPFFTPTPHIVISSIYTNKIDERKRDSVDIHSRPSV